MLMIPYVVSPNGTKHVELVTYQELLREKLLLEKKLEIRDTEYRENQKEMYKLDDDFSRLAKRLEKYRERIKTLEAKLYRLTEEKDAKPKPK